MAADWVELAVVTQPHGVRGQVKVKSFCDPRDGFAAYPQLTDDKGTPIALRITGEAQGQLIVTITGIPDRNAAELWRGRKLGVPKSALEKMATPDSFYVSELNGMEVVDLEGAALGTVTAVDNFGAGDLLEITTPEGASNYYSFTHANFPSIDRDARRITFTPPEILGSRDEEKSFPTPACGGSRRGEHATFGKVPGTTRQRTAMNRADDLRKNLTEAEKLLWKHLRKSQLANTKFLCQQAIGPYIADFVAMDRKIIIELDGGQHSEETDRNRTEHISKLGYKIIRFWNNDVLGNIEGVLMTIEASLHDARSPLPTSPRTRVEER